MRLGGSQPISKEALMAAIDEFAAAERERQQKIRNKHLVYVTALGASLFLAVVLPVLVIWAHL